MNGDAEPLNPNEIAIMTEETNRDRALIAQANTRHGSITAVFGGIAAVTAVAVAINAGAGQQANGWTLLFGATALIALLAVVGAVCFGLAPHLKGLPHDKTPAAYRQRLKLKAGNDEPSVAEALRLQQILWRKERSSQVALIALGVMTAASFAAFCTMFF